MVLTWDVLGVLATLLVGMACAYRRGVRDGIHRGRSEVLRQQAKERAQRDEIRRMAKEIRETQARIAEKRREMGIAPGERLLFDQEAP